MGRPSSSRRAVVRGLVSPAGWDDEGRVVAVCIVNDQGCPCFVLPGGAGDEVRGHLRGYVSARGILQKRGTTTYIRVESVEPTSDPDGPRAPD